MKTRGYIKLFVLLAVTGIITFAISCNKDNDAPTPPNGITNRIDIKTDSIKSILYHDAIAFGSVGTFKKLTFSQYGHCWDTLEVPTMESSKTIFDNLVSQGKFTSTLTNLKANKKYYVRGYAKSSTVTIYSEIADFTTKSLEPPTLKTDSTTSQTSTSVLFWGTIVLDGGTPISARGVCWGATANPIITGQHAESSLNTNSFSTSIIGLTRKTTYHARVYATNLSGTAYGNDITFSTMAELPQITTTAITGITANTALGGGNITSDGSSAITARGVCWSLTESPTLSNSHTTDGSGSGIFSSNITGLQAGKTYYVRAYAINNMGTVFGNQVNFTIPAVLPTVTTTVISEITASTATCGGNVIDDGGATVTARGVCWSATQNPTTLDSKTINGEGLGAFSSSIAGLSAGRTYYVRAYATNTVGTSYSTEVSYITKNGVISLSTTSITSITATTALSGGNITDDGGATVSTRGVCWSTSQYPTISDNHTTDNFGVGTFTSNIIGLIRATTYYVRAYATNSIGTVYGNQVNLATPAVLPAVTTTAITNITTATAETGGNISDEGGVTIIARGVCWSTSANPTISDSKTADGTGLGGFTSSIVGLTTNITYYVRAYATNTVGTAYGNENSIILYLNIPGPSVTDIDLNNYSSVKIGTQIWMNENLRTTSYSDAQAIPNITDETLWTNLTYGAYCLYNNSLSNNSIYGALYNYFAVVDSRNLCPTGWHVPTDIEWTTLENYLGGNSVAGGKLRESGTALWLSPNAGATNLSGFTARPGGNRQLSYLGNYRNLGTMGFWWTSTEYDVTHAVNRGLGYSGLGISNNNDYKKYGCSVRCIKDN